MNGVREQLIVLEHFSVIRNLMSTPINRVEVTVEADAHKDEPHE
jgi:hypothetical protein